MGTRPLFGVSVEGVTVNAVACERMTPRRVEKSRRIVYVHGGGYCVGSGAMGYGLCSYLAASFDAEVLCVNYRLAPEHPAPAAVDDVAAVLRSLEGRTVVALGDSAGAGALVAALQRDVHDVRSLVLVSPWLDLSADRSRDRELVARDPLLSPEWLAACAKAYAGDDVASPAVSPIFASFEALPPTLVVGGGDDLLAPDARRVAALGLEHVRVREFPDFWHDFALSVGQLAAADESARLIALHFANATGWRARTLAQ
jgi:acetyl esterase/lipase